MKKILIIRAGAIGDVVHTSNLFRSIKQAYPQVSIHYLTSGSIKPLLSADPDIEKVHTIDENFKLFSNYTKELANTLKEEKYDLAINLQPSFKIKGLIFLAGIKKQLVYKKKAKMHAVTNFWCTGIKTFPQMKELKDLKLYLPKENLENAKERVKDFKRPIIIISAGNVFAKRQGRAYPVDKWVELGNALQKKYDGTVILNGARVDKEVLAPLNAIKNSVNYVGELPLIDSCAVIAQADLMLSGDSGPLHIATALGVKSVGLYGSMPIERTGCYSNGINIVSSMECAPCNKRKCKFLKKTKKVYAPCMENISVDEIIEKIKL